VTDEDAAGRAIESIHSQRGALDLLVNNAGVSSDGLFAMMSGEEWDRVINVSLRGFYNCTRPVLKAMIRKKRGSVITISSISGLTGNRGQANYSAAKAGLIGASRSVASEVARLGIRVNVIAPGLIDTEMIEEAPVEEIKKMIPMGRIGRPEEVARVVLFLASEDASYITGQTISVNGGML
jgi:3-oxoacyl-[acyl-carrier protein] reductase